MKIQFCGAAGTVTGSCHLVSTESYKFLVDCGMFQGSKELKERNYCEFLFNPAEIDFVLLTHVHIDHSGLIPKLYKKGFRGSVYTTKATKELSAVVLPDSGHIQEMEIERKNRKIARRGGTLLEPIYTVADAKKCLQHFKGFSYEETVNIRDGISVRFLDAGHILGSAMIEVVIKEDDVNKKMIFTGDIGNINQPIVDDPTNVKKADIVVMESTYGNRCHLDCMNRLEVLTAVVQKTYKKGGNLVIPSFAVERTQDLIYHLKVLREQGKIPPMDIYIDSPMAVEATKIFIKNPEFFDEEASLKVKEKGGAENLFSGPLIHYSLTAVESIAINNIKSGAIIISASGMADAGRIKHHLKHNLWRPESTVLFVGYQAAGTLGRRLLDGEKKVKIHGEEIAVKADIELIDGFSAHADQKGLLKWVKGFEEKPERIFLVHGEEKALETLNRVISAETGVNTIIAEYGSTYDLSKESIIDREIKEERDNVSGEIETVQAFNVIKEKIQNMSRQTGKDTRTLEKLLAQIDEIERELSRVS